MLTKAQALEKIKELEHYVKNCDKPWKVGYWTAEIVGKPTNYSTEHLRYAHYLGDKIHGKYVTATGRQLVIVWRDAGPAYSGA